MTALSNTEYYYTTPELVQEKSLIISGEEVKHISRVMRHDKGDDLYVTDGNGSVYACRIENIEKRLTHCSIIDKKSFPLMFENLVVCIPRLKSADRFETALEKCVELGVTNFIVFDAERSVAKGDKSERWNKIVLAAMKQSLHAHLPEVRYMKNVKELNKEEGIKLVFEQDSSVTLKEIMNDSTGKYFNDDQATYLIFGPEGGLTGKELDEIDDAVIVNMNKYRLRSETAIMSAVSIITNYLDK